MCSRIVFPWMGAFAGRPPDAEKPYRSCHGRKSEQACYRRGLGYGALSYRPEIPLCAEAAALDLDQVAEECEKMLK